MNREITPARLEAFTDGVMAIIITVMVLEFKVPHTDTLPALLELWPVFVSYALSFLLVAEYWMNHLLLFHISRKMDNRILWSNLLSLFTISLIPFFTAFMGENHISPFSTAAYSAWCLVCAVGFLIQLTAILGHAQTEEMRCLKRAAVTKNIVAIGLYLLAVVAARESPRLALTLDFAVAVMYFLPNAWLEKRAKG
jgi:uncharacterized membrane protein